MAHSSRASVREDVEGVNKIPEKLRVFLVEDEGIVAMLIEDMLTEMGHETCAVAGRIDEALHLAQTETFELAILDINLDGKPSYPVADILQARGIPFVFATGYGTLGLDGRFSGIPILQKPFRRSKLEEALSHVID